MRLALDFDDTATRDPVTFIKVAKTLVEAGHEVYIVTMRRRSEGDEVVKTFSGVVTGFIFTDRLSKRVAVSLLNVDHMSVWIDDTPFFIDNNGTGGGHYQHEVVFLNGLGETLDTVYFESK